MGEKILGTRTKYISTKAQVSKAGCEGKTTRTTSYHPQGNGQTKRTNRSLLSLLKSFSDQAKYDCWDELLPQCLMACKCTLHKSSGQSPALLMLGRELRLPFDTNIPLSPTMALTHDTFPAQKIVLQHDTLEMAQQRHVNP